MANFRFSCGTEAPLTSNVSGIRDATGHTTTFIYNAQDQLIETDGASGEVEKRIYDADGNLTLDAKQAPGGAWQKTADTAWEDRLGPRGTG